MGSPSPLRAEVHLGPCCSKIVSEPSSMLRAQPLPRSRGSISALWPFCWALVEFGLCPFRRFVALCCSYRTSPFRGAGLRQTPRTQRRDSGAPQTPRASPAPSAPPLRPCAASAPSGSDLCPSIPRAKKSSSALQNAERATPNPTRAQQNSQRAEIPPSERGRAYTPLTLTGR